MVSHNTAPHIFRYEVMFRQLWHRVGTILFQGNVLEKIHSKLHALSKDFRQWESDVFGSVRKKIMEIKI